MKLALRFLILLLIASSVCIAQAGSYQYFRLGNNNDAQVHTSFGLALMGGGDDLDDAFRWLCAKAEGGDFLILRARGDDEYNPYVNGLCKLNSVATLILPSRGAAQDPAVADRIRKAEIIFIGGGDQANYTRNWKGTPVEDALNANIAAGKPIGGTSAGLAILGQYIYSAEGDAPDDEDLTSTMAMANPYSPRIALRRDFLKIDLLRNTLTDTHFAKRDRMGRTLSFLARIMQDGWSSAPREIAIDEKSAVLVEADGNARVIGPGKGAYFLAPKSNPKACREKTPLTFGEIPVIRVATGSTFDLNSWRGDGVSYSLSVTSGLIHSTQADGQVY